MNGFSREEVREIAQAAADIAVKNALEHVGLETENHSETRRDFEFLRDWRTLCEMSKRRGAATVITLLLTALFALITAGITHWIINLR